MNSGGRQSGEVELLDDRRPNERLGLHFPILAALRQQLNLGDYRKKHWEGSFDEYLDIVREHGNMDADDAPGLF